MTETVFECGEKTIKALTICQPYAELILRGDKRVENRTWPTKYRGPLLIHAGKGTSWLGAGDRLRYPGMSFGAIVGVARLTDCILMERVSTGRLPDYLRWMSGHLHCSGPFCWVLQDVRRLPRPIPWRGRQGLFEVPAEVVGGILALTKGDWHGTG
jgi:hypothetical protein